MINLTPTITLLELLWTLLAILGLIFSAAAIVDAVLDGLTWREDPAYKARGAGAILPVGDLISASLSSVVWLGFIGMGVIAMSIPTSNSAPTQAGVLFGIAIIIVELALFANSLIGRIYRYRVDRRVDLEIARARAAKRSHTNGPEHPAQEVKT